MDPFAALEETLSFKALAKEKKTKKQSLAEIQERILLALFFFLTVALLFQNRRSSIIIKNMLV